MGDNPSRREKKHLIMELFGDSKWASDKEKGPLVLKDGLAGKIEEKGKADAPTEISDSFSFGSGITNRQREKIGVQDSSDLSASYIPSNSASRRPRRQPPKPFEIDDFGFSDILGEKKDELGLKESSEIKFKEKSESLLVGDLKPSTPFKGGGQFQKDMVPSQIQDNVGTESLNKVLSNVPSSVSKDEGEIASMIMPANPPMMLLQPMSSSVGGGLNVTAPLDTINSLHNPTPGLAPVAQNPSVGIHTGQMVYQQFYPLPPPPVAHYHTGDGEMVEELKNAQATFGAALAAHHTNIQSYMQVLLDEARRLAAVSRLPSGVSKDKPSKSDVEDNTKTPVKESIESDSEIAQNVEEEEKNYKYEEMTQTDYELTHPESPKRISLEDIRKKHELDLVEQKRHLEIALQEQTMSQIQELKMAVQKLEIENYNLILKLENIKSHHEVEIEFLKKTNVQEAMLWESRIEKIQQFCFTIEKEYAEKINKMKQNEEELERGHKARIEALQAERLNDLQQLNDLHKAIMEQAFSSSAIYSRGGIQRISLKSPEKPANEEELTEREASLIRKEKQLEVFKLEWEEERRRGIEASLEKERAVKEAEAAWAARREAESRQLARREARTEELSRLVEEMREQALTEAKELAADKLKVQTDRARLEALMKAETGIMANPEHILQMRAEVEAGLEESKEMRTALENERRRLADEWNRLESRLLEVEARERDVARLREDLIREQKDSASEQADYIRRREDAGKAEARAYAREQEAQEKSANLEQQIREIAKERLEIKKDRMDIDSAKSRLDVLLPELGPNESFFLNPPRNYVDPKAIIMRLKAERELESYVVNPSPRNTFS